MLSSSSASRRLGTQLQQVRYNRTPAYPRYKAPAVPVTHPKKDHTGLLRRQFLAWLGPKNMRGEYFRNKYFYPPQDHKPNYIVPNGQSLVDPSQPEQARSFGNDGRNPAVHPFPANPACKTASVISDSLKETIYERVVVNGESSQQLANDYKIKMARIEAIVELQKIEKQYQEQNLITREMEKFSKVMYKMFPLYSAQFESDNLTEIPTPQKTLHQRFLTIAESEPFGPVDAAKIFGLEPAAETLDNIIQHTTTQETKNQTHTVVVGEQKKDDKAVFKFIQAKSGEVGHRYGASRRDTKKDRAIGFDKGGRMVYTV